MATPSELDVIEEKARQKALRQKMKRKAMRGPLGKVLPVPPSLLAAHEQSNLLPADLKELIESNYPNPVISLYLSLTQDKLVPEKGYVNAWHSLKHRAEELSEELIGRLNNEQKQQLTADLEEIETFLDNDFNPANNRGLVIFKSGSQLRTVVGLPIYLRDIMVIDPTPYIKPLEEIFSEYRPVLVVRVHRGQASLAIYHLGRWRELAGVKSLVSKASTKSSKAGKAERLYAEQQRTFCKLLIKRLEKLLEQGLFEHLVLVGELSNTQPVSNLLPTKLQQRLVSTEPGDPEETKNSLTTKVEKILSDLKLAEEKAAIQTMDELPDQERLVTGLRAVIEMLNRSMVRQLLISENFSQPGFVCRRHNYLALEAGVCPFCKRRLWPVQNIIDSAIEAASQQNVAITVFRINTQVLKPYGVAAVTYAVDAG